MIDYDKLLEKAEHLEGPGMQDELIQAVAQLRQVLRNLLEKRDQLRAKRDDLLAKLAALEDK